MVLCWFRGFSTHFYKWIYVGKWFNFIIRHFASISLRKLEWDGNSATSLLPFRWSWIWPRRGTTCPASSPRRAAGTWAWTARSGGRALEEGGWVTGDRLSIRLAWPKRRSSICLWSSLTPNPSSADTDKNCESLQNQNTFIPPIGGCTWLQQVKSQR